MTAIRRGTARRLGIRPPLAARVLQFADAVGVTLDPWQTHLLAALYRRPDRPLTVRPADAWSLTRSAPGPATAFERVHLAGMVSVTRDDVGPYRPPLQR